MTNEYVRKQDALDAFGLSEKTRKYGGDHSGYDTRMLYEIQDTIESIEPADVVPVVHGKYVGEYDGYADGYPVCDMWYCSVCGCHFEDWDEKPTYNYCPQCGAKMDGEE
jgi:rubrerythrin